MDTRRLCLEFPIRAVGKERPIVTRNHGTYTPERTRRFEKAIAWKAKVQMREQGICEPFAGPLVMLTTFYFKRPKKTMFSYPPRADLDNCVKSILDGLQGIVFENDNQIIRIDAEKKWYDQDVIVVSFWEKM